jgi:hypothetical protein
MMTNVRIKIECLLWGKHCPNHFKYMVSVNPHQEIYELYPTIISIL